MRTLAQIKKALVKAHREKNWETAKILSQEKQHAKRNSLASCFDCGVTINAGAKRCAMHFLINKHYGKVLT